MERIDRKRERERAQRNRESESDRGRERVIERKRERERVIERNRERERVIERKREREHSVSPWTSRLTEMLDDPATFMAVHTYVPESSVTALSTCRLPSLRRNTRLLNSTWGTGRDVDVDCFAVNLGNTSKQSFNCYKYFKTLKIQTSVSVNIGSFEFSDVTCVLFYTIYSPLHLNCH